MNIHTEWMTDNQYFGLDYPNNVLLEEAKERFEIQKNSLEGKDALIDGISERIVAQHHTNPLNQIKYDEKIHCDMTSLIHTGSIVEFDDKTWLVTSKIHDTQAYKTGSLVECNNTLKFYNKSGILRTIPCIFSNISIDLETGKYISLPSGHYIITIPSGTITKSDLNLRFILNGSAYKVEGIDNVSSTGLIIMELKDDEINPDDNLQLEIANYYSNQQSPPPSTEGWTVSLAPSDTTLMIGRTLELIAHAYYDGVEDLTKYFSFDITNIDGTTNEYVTVDDRDNFCILTAIKNFDNAGKYINVHVELLGQPSIYYDRKIKLTALI